MKERIRGLLVLVLALVLTVSVCAVPAFAENAKDEPCFVGVVDLGGSLSYGFGVPDAGGNVFYSAFGDANFIMPTNSFSWILANSAELGSGDGGVVPAQFHGAKPAWRASELRSMLEYGFAGDEYSARTGLFGGTSAVVAGDWQARYIDAVRDADLITLECGSSELLRSIVETVLEYTALHTEELTEAGEQENAALLSENCYQSTEALCGLLELLHRNGFYGELAEAVANDAGRALNAFCSDWDALVADVRALNPDALILALSVPDVADSVAARGLNGSELLAGLIRLVRNIFTAPANSYIANGYSSGQYKYCDISALPMWDSADGFNPGAEGHAYIAAQLRKAIFSMISCAHKNVTRVGAIEPTEQTPGYTGDTFCKDCGELIRVGVTRAAKSVCAHEKDGYEQLTADAVEATEEHPGYTGNKVCSNCGEVTERGRVVRYECRHTTKLVGVIQATKEHLGFSGNEVCTKCNKVVTAGHTVKYVCPHDGEKLTVGFVRVGLFREGYSGDTVCADCGELLEKGCATRFRLFG